MLNLQVSWRFSLETFCRVGKSEEEAEGIVVQERRSLPSPRVKSITGAKQSKEALLQKRAELLSSSQRP